MNLTLCFWLKWTIFVWILELVLLYLVEDFKIQPHLATYLGWFGQFCLLQQYFHNPTRGQLVIRLINITHANRLFDSAKFITNFDSFAQPIGPFVFDSLQAVEDVQTYSLSGWTAFNLSTMFHFNPELSTTSLDHELYFYNKDILILAPLWQDLYERNYIKKRFWTSRNKRQKQIDLVLKKIFQLIKANLVVKQTTREIIFGSRSKRHFTSCNLTHIHSMQEELNQSPVSNCTEMIRIARNKFRSLESHTSTGTWEILFLLKMLSSLMSNLKYNFWLRQLRDSYQTSRERQSLIQLLKFNYTDQWVVNSKGRSILLWNHKRIYDLLPMKNNQNSTNRENLLLYLNKLQSTNEILYFMPRFCSTLNFSKITTVNYSNTAIRLDRYATNEWSAQFSSLFPHIWPVNLATLSAGLDVSDCFGSIPVQYSLKRTSLFDFFDHTSSGNFLDIEPVKQFNSQIFFRM